MEKPQFVAFVTVDQKLEQLLRTWCKAEEFRVVATTLEEQPTANAEAGCMEFGVT